VETGVPLNRNTGLRNAAAANEIQGRFDGVHGLGVLFFQVFYSDTRRLVSMVGGIGCFFNSCCPTVFLRRLYSSLVGFLLQAICILVCRCGLLASNRDEIERHGAPPLDHDRAF
jgi:hypothetical protein